MGKRQTTTRMVAIMTEFEIPEYYNQSKPKPKEEVLIERKCNICGKLAKMGKFERYCSHHCKAVATKIDNTYYSVKFR